MPLCGAGDLGAEPITLLANLYWSLLILAFGSCVGSFLNVIIYRWPRDLLLRRPLWSFCPRCGTTLRWCDNIPVLGYVFLGGRCRYCRGPISLQYPLVELATAFAFLITYDAFFVARLREGVVDLGADWALLLGHWALCAGLIVLAVMDLEAYLVDIRVTWLMLAAGLIAHALWAPPSSTCGDGGLRPGPLQAMVAAAATFGVGIGVLLFRRPEEHESDKPGPPKPSAAEAPNVTPSPADAAPAAAELMPGPATDETASPRPRRLASAWILVCCVFVLGYVGLMLLHDYETLHRPYRPLRIEHGRVIVEEQRWPLTDYRIGIGVAALFVGLALVASHPHPEEDEAIVEAIAAEAPDARRQALRELVFLSPALLLTALVLGLSVSGLGDRMVATANGVLHWQPVDRWQPLWGLSTALAGWIIGGAIGWGMRIVFTLVLRKEALGMGDVHILAGTGAIAGWIVSGIGFFVAAPLALLGLIVIHLRRQSRALPYGPWLGLAFFIVALYQDRILQYLHLR